MHHQIITSSSMDPESHMAPDASAYDHDSWVNMGAYPPPTMAGFGAGDYSYVSPIATTTSHALPSQSLGRMPPPPLAPLQSPQQQKQEQQDHTHQQLHQSPQQQLHQSPQQQLHQSPQQHQQSPLPAPTLMPSASHHAHHHQLPALMVPSNPTWPSMLTNPGSYSAPAPSTMAVAHPSNHHLPHSRSAAQLPPPPLKTTRHGEGKPNPRKMLTDDDRRRMCEYADKNPGVKQSEIGNLFGVERSTVSKVLRNKDKYLSKDDRSNSPSRKNRNKFPDIERAVTNWVRNAQKNGTPITDSEIKEKFRVFATSTGNAETILKATSASWLEKFKQRNGVGSGRLVRRASETNIPDRRLDTPITTITTATTSMESPLLAPLEQSNSGSPVSPGGHLLSTSPLSAHRSDDGRETLSAGGAAGGGVGSSYLNFSTSGTASPILAHTGGGQHGLHSGGADLGLGGMGISGIGAYKHSNNQSTTSLSSIYTETPVSSFSGSALSPTATFTFSPDSNVGSFLPADAMGPPGSANFQRPRSMTLPALNLDYIGHPGFEPQEQQQQQQHHHQHQQHSHQHHDPSVGQADSMAHKYNQPPPPHAHHSRPPSMVDSPMTDLPTGPPYAMDGTVVMSPPLLRRSSSSGSLFMANPRSAAAGSLFGMGGSGSGSGSSGGDGGGGSGGNGSGSNDNGAGGNNNSGSSSSSPNQDDARRAAEMLLSFIRSVPSSFDSNELIAVASVADKLRLQHHQQAVSKAAGVGVGQGMGGLSRIPEGDVEMGSELHHVKMESMAA